VVLPRLVNPHAKATEVRELVLSLGKAVQESSAKHPFTAQQFQSILFHGFELHKLVGRHNQLLNLLLGGGLLRPKLACNITVKHAADGQGLIVVFSEYSQVWVDEQMDAVVASISKAKNAANIRHKVYIPNSIMGVRVVVILRAYILLVRMPTGV
jgi:hypothetical protein